VTETVYLAIGSNVGDREANIARALELLGKALPGVRVSSLYQTRPLYVTEQPPFLNAAAEVRTRMSPEELLDILQGVEAALGRDRSREIRMGPRTMDLDILLFGERVLETEQLSIPHPRLCERAFALVPLLELAPALRHPATGRPLREALEALGDQGVYSYPRG
jgi:2-amino-4-hydroxy-6-hydroxymethyldihydropteridine diphosphokinase